MPRLRNGSTPFPGAAPDPMVELAEYEFLRARPSSRPAMYQSWRDLTFLHFSLDPQELRPLLPDQLEVDTYPDENGVEKAWIGLVPFWMANIRSRGLPRVPGTHTFPETNVRTYVHRNGREPGVWFFSLEAANRLACAWARRFFSLNYFWAQMKVVHEGSDLRYSSRRVAEPSVVCRVQSRVGPPMPPPVPGSLEFFLVERYLLYSVRAGSLFTGRVHHDPYPLHSAELLDCEETLLSAAGIPSRPWTNVLYSLGVDVTVYPLVRVQ